MRLSPLEKEPETSLVSSLQGFLKTEIAPQANRLDTDTIALQNALSKLNQLQFFGLRVPKVYGGLEASLLTFRQVQCLIPRYSGAFAFLQTQHQSAASFLATSDNQSLKETYLPEMATGETLIGVGFSQLRRTHDSPLTATPVTGGYQLNGKVPWITGYGYFQYFIIGGTLPSGEALYGIVPFTPTQQPDGGNIAFSPPMQLSVMNATNTVAATVQDWFLREDEVLFIKPATAIHDSDKKNVLHHGFYALGCARAGLDILETAAEKKGLPFLGESYETLSAKHQSLSEAMFAALPPTDTSFQYRLNLRVKAIHLAQRCAHAGVIASSGAANAQSHPAQRVYREALLFSVSGQTKDVMEASLNTITDDV
ncbi:MAG: acyl-CoA dehydrogenase family protein [Halothece sp.]